MVKKSHQSKVFVCVSNNCVDAVDQLLIFWGEGVAIRVMLRPHQKSKMLNRVS